MNETTKQPATYPAESPEKWAAVRTAAEEGDTSETAAALQTMELSRRLASLMIVAAAEEMELRQIEAAGQGQAEKFADLGRELAFSSLAQPSGIEDAKELAERQQQLRAERLKAQRAIDAAEHAKSQRRWIALWLPELFGHTPPPHAGYLSNVMVAPKTGAAANALKSDVYAIASWRAAGEHTTDETKRRRYTSFSPLAPKR